MFSVDVPPFLPPPGTVYPDRPINPGFKLPSLTQLRQERADWLKRVREEKVRSRKVEKSTSHPTDPAPKKKRKSRVEQEMEELKKKFGL